jgi:hypothetical protein
MRRIASFRSLPDAGVEVARGWIADLHQSRGERPGRAESGHRLASIELVKPNPNQTFGSYELQPSADSTHRFLDERDPRGAEVWVDFGVGDDPTPPTTYRAFIDRRS